MGWERMRELNTCMSLLQKVEMRSAETSWGLGKGSIFFARSMVCAGLTVVLRLTRLGCEYKIVGESIDLCGYKGLQ